MDDRHTGSSRVEPPAREAQVSRRGLIKRAIATAPVIATLPSGAALARSSNMVTATTPAGALDANGKTQCLDELSVKKVFRDGSIDLGQPPSGTINLITDRDYRIAPDGAPVTEATMCTNGGMYYYLDGYGQWQTVTVPKGILASATALASFTGSLLYKDI